MCSISGSVKYIRNTVPLLLSSRYEASIGLYMKRLLSISFTTFRPHSINTHTSHEGNTERKKIIQNGPGLQEFMKSEISPKMSDNPLPLPYLSSYDLQGWNRKCKLINDCLYEFVFF